MPIKSRDLHKKHKIKYLVILITGHYENVYDMLQAIKKSIKLK